MFYPVTRIVEQIAQASRNLARIDADVLAGAPEIAGPLPCFVEHSTMQFACELFSQDIAAASFEYPASRFQDVRFFPFIELRLGRDVGRDQAAGLIGVERRRAGRVRIA